MRRKRKNASLFSGNKKTSTKRGTTQKKQEKKDDLGQTKRIPVSEISSKTKKSNKKKKKNNSLFVKKMKKTLILAAVVVLIILIGVGGGMYLAITQEIKDMDIHNMSLNYSSCIYYTDELGNSHELEQLYDDGNRIWLDAEEIPEIMKDAIVSIEDERFYKHNGVDLKRTLGAFVGWTIEKIGGKKATYGGSTITQQVIKNITHEKERSSIRKIKEMMRAIALEKELSKDEILTLYLNIVFFSNNCYGVEAASDMYFDKPAADLTLTEAALLAGIPQLPTYYNPLRNPNNALEKRNTVLAKMEELGVISEEELEEALKTDLGLKGDHAEKRSKIYSYFVDQVINDVISDLQTQKGYSETFARQQVYSGGLKIYTTMDNEIQEAMESVFENNSNFPSAAVSQNAQAAMIVIDYRTGEVKGIIGGRGPKTESRGLIRTSQTKRQPGSSLKPISVYAPSIELKKITAATITEDEKITIGDWSPKNSYSGYRGEMPLRKAIEISSNTVAVKTLQELGTEISYNYLKNKFHISTLDPADKDLSPLGLGGLTYGVTVEDLAAAYGVLANEGVYVKPHTYTKVIDNKGKVLLENKVSYESVISEETAYITTSLLKSVISGSQGTGRLARLNNMSAAGKTGTTNGDKDKWFVGYTPYYVGAVWFGFDTPKSIRSAGVTNNVSAKLWGQVMNKVHEELPQEDFEMPSSVVSAWICTKTGRLASSDCSFKSREYFIKGTVPSRECKLTHGEPTPSPSPSPTPEGEEGVDDEIEIPDGPLESINPTASSSPVVSETPGDTEEDVTIIPE